MSKKILWLTGLVIVIIAVAFWAFTGCSSGGTTAAATTTTTAAGGTTTTVSGTTTTTAAGGSSVTISGVVAASTSDLSQLGVSSLGIIASFVNDINLKKKGVPNASIQALNLVPLAGAGTAIDIAYYNTDGTLTTVASGTVDSNGTYSVNLADYDVTKTYRALVQKTSGNKTLDMMAIFPPAANGAISGSDATITPQTTLFTESLLQNIINLENKIPPSDVIKNIKDSFIDRINTKLENGELLLTTIKDASETDGSTAGAAREAYLDSTFYNKIEAAKGAAQLAAATDEDSAQLAIKTIFKGLMEGNERSIPQGMINEFRDKYLEGITITPADITTPLNDSLFDTQTMQPTTGNFTTTQIIAYIQNMIDSVYADGTFDVPANIRYVVEAAFPKTTWADATITEHTVFTVPQTILVIGIAEKLAMQANYGLNHPILATNLGLISGDYSGIRLLHGEIMIKSFDIYSEGERSNIQALEAFAVVGDMTNMTAAVTGYTVWLTYPTASGNETVQLTEQTFGGQQPGPSAALIRTLSSGGESGPPPGMKNYTTPQANNSAEGQLVDFTSGTATITLKNSDNETVAALTQTIPNISLSSANLVIDYPKQAWLNNIAQMDRLSEGTQPTITLTAGNLPTLPDGYRLAAAIHIMKGTISSQGNNLNFQTNWGESSNQIYDSFNKRNFIPINSGTNNIAIPATLTDAGLYQLGIGLVVINTNTNFPIMEGSHSGTLFVVGELDQAITDTTIRQEFQQEFVEVDISTEDLALTGQVHADQFTDPRFEDGTLLIGLVRSTYDSTDGFRQEPVSNVTPVTLTDVSGQTYKTFSLNFNGSVFSTKYGHYEVVLFNDLDGDGELDLTEPRQRSVKDIEHKEFGTKTHWQGGGAELVDSQTGFNIIRPGSSF